jgi:zinc protease
MRTLANGLRVVVVEDHAAPVVQTAVWYRFGSLDEQPGKTGLAHALEHMMFRGTRAISGGGLDEIGARLGAVINADTREDTTHFYFIMPADRLDLALRIEADRMRGLLLRERDWELEKGAVLSEYDNDESQPLFALGRAVRAAAYPGSPYARLPLGVRADVVRSTAADLRAYYDRYYAPNDATLVVTGDVRAETVFAEAQADFGALARRPVPAPRALPPPGTVRRSALTISADYPYTAIDLTYRIPGDLDRDAAATQILANIINNTRSAFYTNLVLSKLTLGYSASADTALHAGTLQMLLVVTPGVKPADARAAYERTLAAMLRDGIDPDLLAAAKTADTRQAVYARDSISGLGDRYGYALGVEGHDPAIDDRETEALDAATVNAAARTYLARPTVVGTLVPRTSDGRAGAAPTSSSVSDSFSKRPPSGAIVIAPWARAALERPLRLGSNVEPVAYTLPNGLRLLVQPVHANPTVFVSGTIEVSPAFDPPGQTGLGSLTSTLMSYGGTKYDFLAQQKVGDDLAADISLGFSFGAHGLARDLPTLLDVLADGERAPAFPQRYVSYARDQEIAAISERDRNPDARADRAFARALYAPGDPALRDETAGSLAQVSRRRIQAYAARYLRPDHTTLIVAGDVDPDAVRAQVERAFGDWQNAGTVPSTLLPPLPPTKRAITIVPAQRPAVSVRLGERAVGRLSPDFYPLTLLNEILGADGTFDTRLMREIRVKRGLVYGVSSTLAVTRERGILEIDLSAAPRDVQAAVRLVKENVARLTREPVAQAELTNERTKLIASTLVSEESTQSLVARCDSIARFKLPLDYFRTFAARYARYTPVDLLKAAKRYFRPNDFAEVYVGGIPVSP